MQLRNESLQNSRYWNKTADTWTQSSQQKLLRLVSDILNHKLLQSWLPNHRVNLLLKTDMFDESLTPGLHPLLSKYAAEFIGIDLSVVTIQSAQANCDQLQAFTADVRHLPFPSETFDIIVSNSTLDHFNTTEDIILGLKELNRVLKENGQLLITLDNYTNPYIYLRNNLPFKLLNRLRIVPYYVGKSFGPFRFKRVLEALDFVVIEVTSFWHFPRIFLVCVAKVLDKYFSDRAKSKFLKGILAFEFLSKLPTRYITGQFIAVNAKKKS